MPARKTKNVLVLGSTGSIGRNTLEVLARLRDRFNLYGIAAAGNYDLLASQAIAHKPRVVGIANANLVEVLKEKLSHAMPRPAVVCGEDALAALAARGDVDIVVCAVSGSAGLPLTLAAVRAGKRVALANKESLVMAGGFIMREAKKRRAEIIPVDSEHSALFQSLQGHHHTEIAKIILTASGGAFPSATAEEAEKIAPSDALNHPTWNMGPKVTIDSATMMNKALEVIEAHWLFGVPASRIEVLVHPQAIIHSMVEFCDSSLIAQLAVPDMKLPIQYALTFPERLESPCMRLNLATVGTLSFQRPTAEKTVALRLGFRTAEEGGTMGAVLNAANEVAVRLFLERRILFPRIPRLVEEVMNRHCKVKNPALKEIFDADKWARAETLRRVK